MRKNISYCHPSFSLENVKGSSNYKIIKCGRSLDLAFQLGAMTAILFSFNAYAECTPTPDCASIGYTETSCEGDSLKCPFDISKLYCIPCDSSFKYDCSGDNIVGGTGSACGGKYVSCECVDGLPFNNGICPQSCKVGMIYYSDKSCSTELDNSKTAIGVVVKDNELIISQIRSTGMQWGTYGTDIPDLPNKLQGSGFNGKSNTAILVAFQTTEGKTASNSAAINCHEYSTAGTSVGDWYLPDTGELHEYVYGGGTNYNKINTTMITLGWTLGAKYWASSEKSHIDAWYIAPNNGGVGFDDKDEFKSVACFLAIN